LQSIGKRVVLLAHLELKISSTLFMTQVNTFETLSSGCTTTKWEVAQQSKFIWITLHIFATENDA